MGRRVKEAAFAPCRPPFATLVRPHSRGLSLIAVLIISSATTLSAIAASVTALSATTLSAIAASATTLSAIAAAIAITSVVAAAFVIAATFAITSVVAATFVIAAAFAITSVVAAAFAIATVVTAAFVIAAAFAITSVVTAASVIAAAFAITAVIVIVVIVVIVVVIAPSGTPLGKSVVAQFVMPSGKTQAVLGVLCGRQVLWDRLLLDGGTRFALLDNSHERVLKVVRCRHCEVNGLPGGMRPV